MPSPSFFILLAMAGWCAYTDLRHGRIGNWPCVAGLAAGLALAWWQGGYRAAAGPDLLGALGCVALAFFLFWSCYRAGAVGAGDVKLMTAVGALCPGMFFFLHVLMFTALAGAALALLVCWRHGRFWSGLGAGVTSVGRIRYGGVKNTRETPTRETEGKSNTALPVTLITPQETQPTISNTTYSIKSCCDKPIQPALKIPYAMAILAGILITWGYYVFKQLPGPF